MKALLLASVYLGLTNSGIPPPVCLSSGLALIKVGVGGWGGVRVGVRARVGVRVGVRVDLLELRSVRSEGEEQLVDRPRPRRVAVRAVDVTCLGLG